MKRLFNFNSISTLLTTFCVFALVYSATGQNNPEIVRLSNGKLVYKKDSKGNQVPDFSAVGYRNGEKAIPNVPVVETLTPVGGDNKTRIQNAINRIQNRKPDRNGFRGALLLKKGTYSISDQIKITKSGVVIRGEGRHDGGTILVATKRAKHDFFLFTGANKANFLSATEVEITDNYVPIGAKEITVRNASGFKVGDRVMLKRAPNHEWIKLLGMDRLSGSGASPWKASEYQVFYKRTITKINGKEITLDAPNVDVIDKKYAKGSLGKYNWSGRIEEVGIENIRFVSYYDSSVRCKNNELCDEKHGWSAVVFRNAEHGWARNIEARHFGYGTISIDGSASNITVDDARNLDPISETTGGKKYSFNVNGQRNLIKNCYTRRGRHDFVTGARVAGPNVFLDCKADNMRSDIGPHHRWSTGILFDNVVGNAELNARNRTTSGSGHGWTGGQIMYWNSKGSRFRVQDPPGDHINWCIGCKGSVTGSGSGGWSTTHPKAYTEFQNSTVTPRSLYEQQLKDRLGSDNNPINNPPTITIISPSNNATFDLGQAITLSANASDPDGNLDKVNFKINDDFYRTDVDRPFETTFTPATAGTYKIGARAFDKEGLGTEVFVTITVRDNAPNQSPKVSFMNVVDGQMFSPGDLVDLQVNATDPDGRIEKVTYRLDGAFHSQDSDAPYLGSFVPSEEGVYELSAIALDNDGASTEEKISIEVSRVTSVLGSTSLNKTALHPNPALGIVHFSDNNTHVWKVMNTQGEVLAEGRGDQIDLSEYASGLYLIVADGQVQRITKQ